MDSAFRPAASGSRQALRKKLLEQRERFVASSAFAVCEASLARHLVDLLVVLEPACLGLYWPHRSEFNAVAALAADKPRANWPVALPFAQRTPVRMHYRAWDGSAPAAVDECGIASSDGPSVVPDVVLVPCVGFTPSGFRLGYGGGYFDRWLADHPEVTAVGVGWLAGRIGPEDFAPEPHDRPLALVITEQGVV